MLVNADCTVYETETYTRHELRGAYWNDSRGRTVSKGGIQVTDSVIVYLYSDEYIPKNGDILVEGITAFVFDAADQHSISESMKQFRKLYPDFAVVRSVQNARYGGLPHTEVLAR